MQHEILDDSKFNDPNFQKVMNKMINEKPDKKLKNSGGTMNRGNNSAHFGLESLKLSNFMESQSFLPVDTQKKWFETQFMGSQMGSKLSDNQQFMEFAIN